MVCDPARLTDTKVKAAAAGAKVVLTLSDQGTGSLIDQAQGKSDVFKTVARENDDIAAILYTSGTTGRSKGAMLTHQNLASNALTLHKIWQWREGDVLLHALPIFHVHGLFVALHCIFLTGGMTIFLKNIRCRCCDETPAPVHGPDWRANFLYTPAGQPEFWQRTLRKHAVVHGRVRASAGRDF